ncbi:hypothetical protein PJL18_04145 [Paenarthrobacter nicotinovorans]|nr:hypothetical protein [Paenarthrobacter nicotinovorans]
MALVEVFATDSGWAIRQHHARQADLRDGVRGPNVRPCQKPDLLLKAEASGEFADLRVGVLAFGGRDGDGGRECRVHFMTPSWPIVGHLC